MSDLIFVQLPSNTRLAEIVNNPPASLFTAGKGAEVIRWWDAIKRELKKGS